MFNFPDYRPDQIPRNGVLTKAENVLPAATGYRAVKSFAAASNNLPAEFRGGASFISSDGTSYLLAGTSGGLYRLASGSWTALVSGLTIPARWRFAQYGNLALCVNGVDMRAVDLSAGTQAAVTAPTANTIAVVGSHVVLGQSDGNILQVSWSALNDYMGWTPGVDQSGFEVMVTGGEVMGVAGGEYGVILQRERLVRMDLTGDSNAPFTFNEITTNFGCASAASIVQAGRTVFFLSDRGFMALDDGQALRPLGNEKFDRTFSETVPRADFERIWAAVDPKRTLVLWGVAGAPGRVWVYNWALDRASTLSLPFAGIFSGYENSLSLDGLDAIYGDLDSIPYSLDDARFDGGDPRLYFVNESYAIGGLTGPNLKAVLGHGEIAPYGQDNTRVRSVELIGDPVTGVTCRMGQSQRIGDDPETVSVGNMQASGRIPLRCKGRYLTPEFEIAAGVNWSFVEGFEVEASAGGRR